MAYLGNDLQVAYPSYKNIDDISGSFNGSTTSFALLVNGSAPVPLPLNSQQCLISVGGVIQRPDDSGTEGFRLSGGNIIFSSAPNTGEDFFGVILAGADYVNAGANFPDGSQAGPSITFEQDLDTGFYRSGSGLISVSSNNTKVFTFPSTAGSNGQYLQTDGAGTTTWASAAGDKISEGNTEAEVVDTGSDGHFKVTTEGSERLRVDPSGRLLVGTSSDRTGFAFQVEGTTFNTSSFSATRNVNASGGPSFNFIKTRGSSNGSATVVANGDELGTLGFLGTDGSAGIAGASIAAFVDATPGANDMPGRLVFSTTADGASSPTERLRIQSDGNIVALKPYSTTLVASPRDIYMDSSGFFGYITSTRDSKTNIAEQSDVSWLYSLNPVTFNYKSIDRETGECSGAEPDTQFGLIAEEVEPVCPDICFYDETETGKELRGIDYKKLITPMLKALQQANARIEALEAEVAALKAQ